MGRETTTRTETSDLLLRALARREVHPRRPGAEWVRDAYRLLNGAGDGAPGVAIDRYGEHVVVLARASVADERVEGFVAAVEAALAPRGVVVKRLAGRGEGHTRWARGEDPGTLWVREGDAVLGVELDRGLGTGLFLDLAELRRECRAYARGVEVLNLFAHTGSFSVHAALAGALRVTSVDAVRGVLDRGRESLARSGGRPDEHRWLVDDVLTYLARGGRRGERYGLVILDPPSFGRFRRRAFSLAADLDRLVAGAAAVLAPDGVLVLSIHTAELPERALLGAVRAAFPGGATIARAGLPEWDHPVASEGTDDRGDYLRILVIRPS